MENETEQQKQNIAILNELEEKIKENLVTVIKQQKFRNKKTGEIVTQFSLMEINNFEKVE